MIHRRRAGVRRVVYAGSSAVYGDQPTASKRESDPTAPLSPYAAGKLAGEEFCRAFTAGANGAKGCGGAPYAFGDAG